MRIQRVTPGPRLLLAHLGLLSMMAGACVERNVEPTVGQPWPIPFVADLGGYVFADVLQASDRNQLAVIDPARVADATGAASASPNGRAVVASWDAGPVLLAAALDAHTLVGTRLTADGSTGEIVTVDVAAPFAPAITTTVPLPAGFVGSPQPLGDGNVLVNARMPPAQSATQTLVMNPMTGAVRSVNNRLACASWFPLGSDRLFCLAPNDSGTSVRVYAYSTEGGLGADVTAAYLPGGRDYFLSFAGPSGRLHWFDAAVDGSMLVSAEVDPAGNVTVVSEVPLPTLDGAPVLIATILPLDPGRVVFAVTTTGTPTEAWALLIDDFRTGSDVLLPPVAVGSDYIAQMTRVPALGPTAFAAATERSGVRFFRLDDGGLPQLTGTVAPGPGG